MLARGTGDGRNNNRTQRGRTKWNKGKQQGAFIGKTKEMNGHVFQLQAEQKKKGQFQDSLDQLWIYASSMYKKDIVHLKILFTQLGHPTVVKPELTSEATASEEAIFKEEIRQYIKDKKSLETTLVSLYNVVWGQCSKLLQNKLKANKNYIKFNDTSDVATLLTEIKTLSNKIEENTSIYDSLHEAKVKFYRYQQADDETLAEHMRNFKDLYHSIEYHGGDVFFDKDMIEFEMQEDVKNSVDKATPKEYRMRVMEKAKAVAFIKSASRKTYGKLLNSIREQHSFKIDVYPKTLADAYEMLSAHTNHGNSNSNKAKKDNKTNNNAGQNGGRNGGGGTSTTGVTSTSYLQTDVVTGTDGRTIDHIMCYSCGGRDIMRITVLIPIKTVIETNNTHKSQVNLHTTIIPATIARMNKCYRWETMMISFISPGRNWHASHQTGTKTLTSCWILGQLSRYLKINRCC